MVIFIIKKVGLICKIHQSKITFSWSIFITLETREKWISLIYYSVSFFKNSDIKDHFRRQFYFYTFEVMSQVESKFNTTFIQTDYIKRMKEETAKMNEQIIADYQKFEEQFKEFNARNQLTGSYWLMIAVKIMNMFTLHMT